MDMVTLRNLLDDNQIYHSEWQMDHAITEAHGGTAYGCYVQALRELFRRVRGVKELYLGRETLRNQIAELEERLTGDEADYRKKQAGKFRVREWEIELARHRMGMEDLELNITDTEREFRRFYAQCVQLKAEVGELTPERRAKLDVELWKQRFGAIVAIEMCSGHLSQNTIELLVTCPPDWQDEFIRRGADLLGAPANADLVESRLVKHLSSQTHEIGLPQQLTGNGRSVQALLEGDA